MMNIKKIAPHFSISEQIVLSDISFLSELGIKTLICNRPENENGHLLTYLEVKQEAKKWGIEFFAIPSSSRDISDDALDQFIQIITQQKKNVHAYCKTGGRSSIFWCLSQVIHFSVEKVLANAMEIGVDLSTLRGRLHLLRQKYTT
jgi:sulfide:quinone oxidoreductase